MAKVLEDNIVDIKEDINVISARDDHPALGTYILGPRIKTVPITIKILNKRVIYYF